MKSFFSSRVSKLSVLTTFCTLSISALSLPGAAVAQEACVRTSAGNVVCGTLVPKSSSTQNRTSSSSTIETQVDTERGVKWELQSCMRKPRNVVSCTFLLSIKQDYQYGISLRNGSRLVDSSGNSYPASGLQVANTSAGVDQFVWNMAQGARYPTIIEFTDVPDSLSQVVLLEITPTWSSNHVRFRNVPIN